MCIAVVVGCSLVLIATSASLIGDGSYYLLRAIHTGQPYQLAGRQEINLIREGPLLLARAQGVTNTRVLTLFQGIGFILFPALVWMLAIVHARHSRVRFAVVVLSCGLSFSTLILFSVSELSLALPLVVLASLLLTQPGPWSGRHAVAVIVSTALLFWSHESVVPCALLLVALAVVRIKARLGGADRRVSIVVAALSGAVLGGALWTLIFWPNQNSKSFVNLSQSSALFVIGAFFLLGWIVLYRRVPDAEWLRWALFVVAALFTALGVKVGIHAGPEGAYQSRSLCVVVVVMLQLLLLADWIRLQRMVEADGAGSSAPLGLSTGAARAAAAFLVALLIVPTVCAMRWSSVMGDFRSTLTQRTGIVPVADVPTARARSYLTSWTNTSLSVVLRSSTNDAVVENTGSLNPFDIDTAEQQIPPAYRWGK